jgi:hypothetical protein
MPKLSVDEWLTEIDNGKEFRRSIGREDSWKKLEMDYLNDIESDTALGSNLVFSMGDTLLSSLNIPDPEISVIPEHPLGVDRAPIVEAYDNYLIRKLRLKQEALKSTLHSFLFGRAIWKLGYDSLYGYDPYFDTGTAQMPSGMTLTQFNKKGERIEFGNVSPGMAWCMAVSPHDIVVPWGTQDIQTAPWVAHRVIRLNSSIKSDPKYSNVKRLEPQLSMETFTGSYLSTGNAKKRAREYKSQATYQENTKVLYNELWEICDRSDNTIKVVCYDYDNFLRDSIDAVQVICGTPYVSGTFVQHPRFFWGTPLAHYLGRLQKKEFDIALQAEKQRRINNLKFLVAKGTFISRDRLNRFLSAEVGAVEEADTTDLTNRVQAFPQGNNLEFTLMARENRQDAREAIGLGRNQMGEFDASSRRTAREATFVQMGSSRREGLRSSVVSDLYLDSIPKLNQMTFAFQQRPMYAMVGREFVKFTGEELQGDYLYDLSLSTKRNLSRAERKVEALMTSMQFMQLPGADLATIYDYLKDAVNDPSFERLIPKAGSQKMPQGLPTIPATGGPTGA